MTSSMPFLSDSRMRVPASIGVVNGTAAPRARNVAAFSDMLGGLG